MTNQSGQSAGGGLGDRVEESAAVAARAIHESDDSDRVHHLAVRNLKVLNRTSVR